MSYRYHGRAFTDATSPRAFGICDRCGFQYNLYQLQYQYQYNGTTLYNTRYRVCPTCMDIPQPQLLNPILPPDPLPVNDPRPPNYAANEAGPNVPFVSDVSTGAPYNYNNAYLDLFDGDPSNGGTSVLSTIGASRAALNGILSDFVNNTATNTEDIVFTTSATTGATISWLALYTASTGGTLVASAPMQPAQFVVMRNGAEIPAGSLQLRFFGIGMPLGLTFIMTKAAGPHG